MHDLRHFFILAAFPYRAFAGSYTILPITYQSKGLTCNDWVTLFTLCFAPLIAHVLAGVPQIVHLSQDRPHWRLKIGLFNPTTILWHYFAIADRRLRAKRWRPADMAASNAYFWTRKGWDGSEAVARKCQAYCVSFPISTHTTLLSGNTIKTVIVTLQGANALYFLVLSSLPTANQFTFGSTASVGSLFFPLAIFGLLRLFACFWLTDDFVFADCEELQTTAARLKEPENIQLVPTHKLSTVELLSDTDAQDCAGEDYLSPKSWRSRVFRALFLLPIFGLIVLCLLYLLPVAVLDEGYPIYTATTWALIVSYLFFLVVTISTYLFYFIRDRNTTTVLPCVTSWWYQVYTGVLMALILILIVISSIETRKSVCGYYTTWPEDACGNTYTSTKNMTDGVFGVAIAGNVTALELTQPEGEASVLYFEGSCLGYFYTKPDGVSLEGFQINITDLV
jgi:hypothetical protein